MRHPQFSFFEYFCKRNLIDQFAACRIQQNGGRFHHRQFFGIHKIGGFGRDGKMQADNVALCEQFLNRQIPDAEIFFRLFVSVCVKTADFASEDTFSRFAVSFAIMPKPTSPMCAAFSSQTPSRMNAPFA